MENKDKYIKILRDNNFNCFPIPQGKKIADGRYQASKTHDDQPISVFENFGYIAISGNCTIDFDDERYGKQLEEYATKYMVIKSPHGYHLPIVGISGITDKVELHDYKIQDKKIIEIQGPNHYCVGPGSKLSDGGEYKNIGTLTIFDIRGTDFHQLIQMICDKFKVTGKKKQNASAYSHLRDRFREGLPPNKGQSNDYFQQAALVCNTEGNTRDEAIQRIEQVYKSWEKSDTYSGRPWNNILQKIDEVYDNDQTVHVGGHKQKKKGVDTTEVAMSILDKYKLYSDKETGTIYEETNGFVKIVTTKLKYRIGKEISSDIHTTNEILFQITSNAEDLPKLDEDIIVFKNGYYRISTHGFHEHDDRHGLAIMGFENYDYKETPSCPMFEKFMLETFPDVSMRDYAFTAASCCVVPEHQQRITMCYGEAGTGKTTFREILAKCLGEYAKEVDNNSIFNDMFGLADWENKTFVSLAEAPKSLKEFDKLKRITGESKLQIRKMHTALTSVPNYTKIIMDSNNLFKIPEDEAGPMFDRLHLLEFSQRFRYTKKDIRKLSSIIAEQEGEDVISLLLMVYDPENEYPTPKQTKERWEDISIPEKSMFKKLFRYDKDENGMSPMDVKVNMEEVTDIEVDMNIVRKLAKDAGYQLLNGVYKGMTLTQEASDSSLEKYQ